MMNNSKANNVEESEKKVEEKGIVRTTVDEYLMDAIKCGEQNRMFDALINYNKVLSDDKSQGKSEIVFGERTAIYNNHRLFSQCLNNMDLAEKNFLDMSQFNNVREYCELFIKRDENKVAPRDFLNMVLKVNKKIPFIADCIKYHENGNKRSYLAADQDLKIGDIIAKEPPYFTVPFSRDQSIELFEQDTTHQRCFHCLKDNFLDLIACSRCKLAMFCGNQCRNDADAMYHKYECKINKKFDGIVNRVRKMRLFFYALYLFDDKIEDLISFLASRKGVKKTIFDYDLRDFNSRESRRNLLHCFISIDGIDTIPVNEDIGDIMKCHRILAALWENHKVFIMVFLHRIGDIMMTSEYINKWPSNSTELLAEQPQDDIGALGSVHKIVASGYFMFYALFNHSCIPNVHRYFNESNKLCYIVIRNIKKGDKLTISYEDSSFFLNVPKDTRLYVLNQLFGFHCTCEACKGSPLVYGTIFDQPIKDSDLFDTINEMCDRISLMTQKDARKEYYRFMKIYKKNMEKFPSIELAILQHHIFYILKFTTRPADPFS